MKSFTQLRRSSVLAATLCALLFGCKHIPCEAADLVTQPAAAQNGLSILQRVVNNNNFAYLGFRSADEARRAVLAQNVPIREISLSALRSYRDGMSLQRVAARPREWLYFVTVDRALRSSLVVLKVGQQFEPTRIGNAGVVQRLQRLDRSRLDGYSIVQIPALNISFLSYTESGVDMLSPLSDFEVTSRPPQTLRAGQPRRATEVLQLLAPMAALVSDQAAS